MDFDDSPEIGRGMRSMSDLVLYKPTPAEM